MSQNHPARMTGTNAYQLSLAMQAARELPRPYPGAALGNPWTIISNYLPRSTLHKLLFVCKQTYTGAIQALWKDLGARCPIENRVDGGRAGGK